MTVLRERPDIRARLDMDLVAWLTTVSAAGQPQPSVIWYVIEDEHLVIYSKDRTPRLRNIRRDPRVALHLNSDRDGDDLLIIEGEAAIIGTAVPPSQDPGYVAKYEPHLPRWEFTWPSYDEGFPVRIHVQPTRLRT